MIRNPRVFAFRLLPDAAIGGAGLGQQFRVRADCFHLAGLLADPDRQRRAPVTLARQRPVHVVAQEIAEAAFLDVLGQPVDRVVVLEKFLFELACADEPALPGVLDERVIFRPRAEGVLVLDRRLVIQDAALFQLLHDLLVAVLYPAALVLCGGLRTEVAVGLYCVDQRDGVEIGEPLPLVLEQQEVHFAVRRRDVHDARAGLQVDEVGGDHAPGDGLHAAVLARGGLAGHRAGIAVEWRRIAQADQVAAFAHADGFEVVLRLAGDVGNQRAGDVEALVGRLVAHQGVVDVRADGGEVVADQRPGRRRPDKERNALRGIEGSRDRGIKVRRWAAFARPLDPWIP